MCKMIIKIPNELKLSIKKKLKTKQESKISLLVYMIIEKVSLKSTCHLNNVIQNFQAG